MKKSLLVVLTSLLTVACTSCSSKETIHLQLVPSNDPNTLLSRGKALESVLAKYEPNYKWTIDVGESYASTMTALTAGQLDGGFLPSAGYAQASIEKPGKAELLLSAARNGYKVQQDFPGTDAAAREKQRKAMNDDSYDYRGQQDPTQVNFYCSVVITLRDSARKEKNLKALDTDGDGEISLAEIHDAKAKWGIMKATSSSGYVYPTKYIYENGYTRGFIDENAYAKLSEEDSKLYMIGIAQDSYPAMIDNLMNGVIDVAVGFFDIRYGSAFVQDGGKYKNDETVFTKTYTQAVLDPIMNDTVCAYSGISEEKKKAIKNALYKAVKDGDVKDDGGKNDVDGDKKPSGSYLLYQIYSHTNYIEGKDSDYDAAREMYRWTLQQSKK